MRMKIPAVAVVAALGAAGCVTTGTYDKKVAELDQLRAAHDKAAADREAQLGKQIADLQHELADSQQKLADTQQKLADAQKQLADTQKQLADTQKQRDDRTALAEALKKRLEKLGQNVDQLTSEKGQLAQVLADAKARLEELRKQKQAAEARAATFRNLVARLRSMIDSGQLKVVIRDGRMEIALPNDVLFDSGKTNIKTDGQTALAKVAQVLAGIPDRKFLVAGDTDNVPIHSSKFPSNWELSTARAVEVTKFLVQNGMKPEVLAAAGYGEWDPVVANDTPEHRAQNRRIEIVLQPNLSDLPPLDDLQKATSSTP
jgi:chemotaxis protein MotB